MKILPALLTGIALSFTGVHTPAQAQQTSLNTMGTDFWLSVPPIGSLHGNTGGTPSLKLYITAPVVTRVVIKGMDFRESIYTEPNKAVEVTVPQAAAQAYLRDLDPATPSHREDTILTGRAIHISSETPIAVHGAMRTPYSSDGFVALPTSALGKEYVADAYYDGLMIRMQGENTGPSIVTVTAPHENTVVTVRIGGNAKTATGNSRFAGATFSKTLNRGDVMAIDVSAPGGTLSGTYIKANKPVSVLSGTMCADVPVGTFACDYLVESEMPIQAWGKNYHVVPITCRTTAPLVHVFAKDSNTSVSIDGATGPSLPEGPGGREGKGWLEIRTHSSPQQKAVTLSAEKPIYVHQFNTGERDDNAGCAIDPFQMALMPVEQYQKEVLFSVPGTHGGMSFPNNYAILIYTPTQQGTIPDDLQIAALEGNTAPAWQSVAKAFGAHPGLALATQTDGRTFYAKTIKLSQPATYRIKADKSIGVYLYGHSQYDSYGFPASAALNNLQTGDTEAPGIPPLEIQPDGSVSSSVQDHPATAAQRSNLAAIYLQEDSYNYTLSVDEFIPGSTKDTRWEIFVTDKSKPARAALRFVDQSGNDTTAIIQHGGGSLPARLSSTSFGEVLVDSTAHLKAVVENTAQKSISILHADLTGEDAAAFSRVATLPFLLQENGSADSVALWFTPRRAGLHRAQLRLVDAEGNTVVSEISGMAVENISSAGEAAANTFLAYPNPTRDFTTVKFTPSPGSASFLSVINTAGHVVRSGMLPFSNHDAEFRVDFSELPSGVYIIHILSGASSHQIPVTVSR